MEISSPVKHCFIIGLLGVQCWLYILIRLCWWVPLSGGRLHLRCWSEENLLVNKVWKSIQSPAVLAGACWWWCYYSAARHTSRGPPAPGMPVPIFPDIYIDPAEHWMELPGFYFSIKILNRAENWKCHRCQWAATMASLGQQPISVYINMVSHQSSVVSQSAGAGPALVIIMASFIVSPIFKFSPQCKHQRVPSVPWWPVIWRDFISVKM